LHKPSAEDEEILKKSRLKSEQKAAKDEFLKKILAPDPKSEGKCPNSIHYCRDFT
jgi:hypothetical protein